MSVSKMQKAKRLFLLIALNGLLVGCHSQFTPKPYYAGQHRQIIYHDELYEKMKIEIQKFYGAPYKWGGKTPDGTDCSGMVKTIYKNAADITLPHNAQAIFNASKKIFKIDLQFGDLVFFSSNGHRATHMGIYIDKNFFLHASSSRGVILSKLTDQYYKSQFIGAGRIEIY